MDDEEEQKLQRLREDIRKGLESGDARPLEEITTDDVMARALERLRRSRPESDESQAP